METLQAFWKSEMGGNRRFLALMISTVFLWMPLSPNTASAQGHSWQQIQQEQEWATQRLAKSPRESAWVTFKQNDRTMKAWIDYPTAKGKAPVVIVLHEAFGLTDSTRNTADRIAEMGYIAIVPDMLAGFGPSGGGVDSFAEAESQMKKLISLSDQTVTDEINSWADYGRHLAGSSGKFFVVGLSWGGGAAFHYATMTNREDLKSIFVFYDVGPPRETQKYADAPAQVPVDTITAPIHGFYPTNDTRVMKSFQATKDAMAAAHKTFDAVVYEGADHAYMRLAEDPSNTNPANVAAWKASLERLENLLKAE